VREEGFGVWTFEVLRAARIQRETVSREWNWRVGQWESLHELLELKERTQALYFKRWNSRLGELDFDFFVHSNNYMYSMIAWIHDLCCICEFLHSGNFPKTAWRAIHSRLEAHTNLGVFWVPLRNRLAVKPCTAKRLKPITQFWVFLMNCVAMMSFRQAVRVWLIQFMIFCAFYVVLFEEKFRGSWYGMFWRCNSLSLA